MPTSNNTFGSGQPLPADATPVGGGSKAGSSVSGAGQPLPAGATPFSSPGMSQNQPQAQGDYLSKTEDMIDSAETHASNIGENFLKAAEGTASGVADMLHKIPGVGEMLVPQQGLDAMHKQSDNTVGSTADKVIGYGGETLMEFLIGDEAIKGLSLADRLLQSGKIAKILQGSPRVMAALKAGANLSKAETLLSPEARAAIKANPVLGRLVSAGLDAIRSGAVQGVEGAASTLKRTGDAKEAATEGIKQGAEMAGTTAALGVPMGLVTGSIAKLGEMGKQAEKVAAHAAAGPEKATIASKIAGKISAAENSLHQNYEGGIADLSNRLDGAEISAQDNPLATKAKQLLLQPNPEEHELVAQATKTAGAGLDADVKELLDRIATGQVPVEGEAAGQTAPSLLDQFGKPINAAVDNAPEMKPMEPLTITDLIGRPKGGDQPSLAGLRQRIREIAERYQPGDINSRTLKRLLYDPLDKSSAMDDAIEQLAAQSHDVSAVDDYRKLRANYRDKINIFNEDPIINKLRDGNTNDASRDFVSFLKQNTMEAGKSRKNLSNLEKVIGASGVKEFGKDVFDNMMRESMEDSKFNPAKFLTMWDKITPETKQKLFDATAANKGIKDLLADTASAARLQYLTKLGLIGAAGSTVGFAHGGASIVTLAGLLATERGLPQARQVLDWVANHPSVLRAYAKAGEGANSAVAKAAGSVAKAAAGKAVTEPRSVRRDVYSGTADSLAPQQ